MSLTLDESSNNESFELSQLLTEEEESAHEQSRVED